MEDKQDSIHYWKMSEPYETKEDAKKAIDEFLDAVEKARHEFRIKDVHVISMVNYSNEDNVLIVEAHFGNSRLSIPMLETALQYHKNALKKVCIPKRPIPPTPTKPNTR